MGPCKSKSGIAETQKKNTNYMGLTNADQLSDFDTFFTAESKSACKKCCTKEIWEEYKD